MQINTNLNALHAQRSSQRSALELGVSMERLSSGLRINSARDDAAGLAITERLTAGVNGMNRAAQNVNDGISLLQVADGAASQLAANFQRVRELAVQAGNGSYSKGDRQSIQREVDDLMKANYDIVNTTRFNNLNLLDGSFQDQFQVGAEVGQTISLSIPSVLPKNLTTMQLADVPLKQVNAIGTPSGPIAQGDLVLNGIAIGASVAGAGAGQGSGSAYAVARAITNANAQGFTASAVTTINVNLGGGGNIGNASLSINGVDIGPMSGASGAALAASAAAAISGAAGASGVSASASGATLTLTAADGSDISVGGPAAGALGLGGLTRGKVTISNAAAIDAKRLVVSGNNPTAAGFNAGTVAPQATGDTVSVLQPVGSGDLPIDLGQAENTADALTYIDSKIDSINTMRAQLGATENRLAMAHDNVLGGAMNLSAARARIRDTDFASETMQLTRNQILQQAGTAMVAQANALHSQALALLR
ncbi:MAG: flagellin [Pseudomonadota bacterium]